MAPDYDCILIPGGGLLPDGSLPPWSLARVERALELQGQTRYIGLLSGGTVHKPPPRDGSGRPIFESRAAADYLLGAGCPPDKLLSEICSYDTIGNAYYSRLLFAAPLDLKKIHLISSDFHLPRVRAAFEWVYSLSPRLPGLSLSFESVPDQGLSPASWQARRDREAASLQALEKRRLELSSLRAFTVWLYSQHAAYAPGDLPESLSGKALDSYLASRPSGPTPASGSFSRQNRSSR